MAIDLGNLELKQAWDQLTRLGEKTNWLLFEFENATSNKLKLVGTGEGGIEELKNQLKPDQIQFGAFRVIAVDNREATASRRSRFIWFTYIGPAVSVLKKARVSVQKPELAKFFQSAQYNLELTRAEELTKNDIAKKLLASGGAQKPTYYEFTPDDMLPVADIK